MTFLWSMSLPPKHALRVVALIALAAGLNLIPIVAAGHTPVLLGPFVYLPLVMLLPVPWAVVAAAIPMAVTVLTLHHPFILLVSAAEALWLAWWLRGKGRSVVVADLAFWALVGVPLVIALYGGVAARPAGIVTAVAIIQLANHFVVVAISSFVVRHSGFASWITGRPAEPSRVRQVQLDAAFLLALVPLLFVGFGVAVTVRAYRESQGRVILTETARRISQQMELFFEQHEAVIANVAALAGRGGSSMEVLIEEAKRAHPEFITMLMADADGIIRYTAPAAALPEVGGMSITDREYFQVARDQRTSYVSGVFRGRGFGNDIIVAISAPILDPGGRFQGIVQGALRVQEFARMIVGPDHTETFELLITDRHGRVIFADLETGVTPLTKVDLLPQAALLTLPNGVRFEFDRQQADRPAVPYVAYAARADGGHGGMVIAQRPLFVGVEGLTWLLLVFCGVVAVVIGAAVWVARNVRSLMVIPLERFVAEATLQAETGTVAPIATQDKGAAYEVMMVFRAFNQLAKQLSGTYEMLRQHNAELDHKVSERTKELQVAREQADAANRSKTDFLAMTSHEIRTPLNAIIGVAAALQDDARDNETRDLLQTIRISGVRLLNVVNDVLDLSRAEAGKLELQLAPIEVGALLSEVEQLFRLRARKQGLALRVDLGGIAPLWVESDALRLQQILINLVGNSLKFTRSGSVTLRVSRVEDPDGVGLRFAVIDTGPGIATEHQTHLFEPYVQLSEAASSRVAGTGLGLAISRRLVALFGGELALRSEVGQGSEFYFTVKTRLVPPPAAAPVQAKSPLLGVRVLAADDNLANQEVLRLMLEPFCDRLEVVSSAQEAIECLQREAFEVALIDLEMPGGNGYLVAEAVRKDPRFEGQKAMLVAISAHSRSDVWPDCEASGFDAFIAKPIDRRALLELVGRARSAESTV